MTRGVAFFNLTTVTYSTPIVFSVAATAVGAAVVATAAAAIYLFFVSV